MDWKRILLMKEAKASVALEHPDDGREHLSPIPQIKYATEAHRTTIEDDGSMISLYVYPHDQHPDRFVCETHEIDCLVSLVDINNKGNIQGIEIILKRR